MIAKLKHPVVALAALFFLAACQDSPEPVAPTSPQASVQTAQDHLEALFRMSWPQVMALPGTVFADNDEAIGKLVFGVENAGAGRAVDNVLTRLGVPRDAYEVQVTLPIVNMATLRDRWRPTQGGIQIHFSRFLCTLGFNVDHSGGRSFITNSHCTEKQGGTEGTEYYQPTSSIDPTVIATEADDPQYFTGGVCPRGKKCRFSDASRALYSGDVTSTRGAISRTSGPNNGSLDVVGTFSVTSQDNTTDNFAIGKVVNKVGRTTGWTQGEVTRTCVNTSVSGSNIMQLCQTFVGASVAGGDSGSPVFGITSSTSVELVGILWGGSSDGSTYVFSPLKNIQQELGSVTATQ